MAGSGTPSMSGQKFCTDGYTLSIFATKPSSNNWSRLQLPPTVAQRSAAAVCSRYEKVVMVGGFTPSGFTKDAVVLSREEISSDTDSVVVSAFVTGASIASGADALPYAAYGAATVAGVASLLLFGGMNRSGQPSNDLWLVDVSDPPN